MVVSWSFAISLLFGVGLFKFGLEIWKLIFTKPQIDFLC